MIGNSCIVLPHYTFHELFENPLMCAHVSEPRTIHFCLHQYEKVLVSIAL